MNRKLKMIPSDLIKIKLKPKGIKFDKISEHDATIFLEQKSYYYKFASYRHNFKKEDITDENGIITKKYIDLDFFDLVNISKFDKKFRFILLELWLEIEHAVTSNLLKDISYNNQVDGYGIVSDFVKTLPHEKSIEELISRGKNVSSSVHQLYNKLKNIDESDIAIWQIVEFLYASELPYLYKFYYKEYPDDFKKLILQFPKEFKKGIINHHNINEKIRNNYLYPLNKLFLKAVGIRNIAAHNNVLLISLNTMPENAISTREKTKDKYVNEQFINLYLRENFKLIDNLEIKASYRFQDIVALFKLYQFFCSPTNDNSKINSLKEDLSQLISEIKEKEKFNDISPFLINLKKIIDNMFS